MKKNIAFKTQEGKNNVLKHYDLFIESGLHLMKNISQYKIRKDICYS